VTKNTKAAPHTGAATVTVCRDCCGPNEKNPGTDHTGQLANLREGRRIEIGCGLTG
jgi:hypothetical protein